MPSLEIPGFQVEGCIAEGGMACVYTAVQESLGRRVALKVLRRFDRPAHAERFLHEGRIIASLNHRNIITIHDIGAVGDRHYIAMEYLEGGSLEQRIAQGMPLPEVLDLLESIGGCLDFVHRRGVIHRDVKPGNILFHADGTPKLTDFGIAKQLDGDQELTMDGSAFGSPYYLSPEQAEGRPLDGRSDIYGLGIVFYRMLTGHKPYAQDSPIETIVAHLTQPIPVLPEEFSAYQDLLERMLAKHPDDRVASARTLVDLVRGLRASGAQSRHGTRATRAGGPRPGWLGCLAEAGRSRWPALPMALKVVLGLVLLALAGGAILLPGGRGTHREAASAVTSAPAVGETGENRAEGSEWKDAAALMAQPQAERSPMETSAPAARTAERPISLLQPDETRGQATGLNAVRARQAVAELAVQPPATGSPGELQDRSAEAIDQWLQAADRALREYRLTTPSQDNAYAYYRKVIALDPAHAEARAGIERIAQRYVALARMALNRANYRLARLYVRRGTEVQPDHVELSALRAQLDEMDRAGARTPEPPPETWQGSKGTGNIVKDFKKLWRSVFD